MQIEFIKSVPQAIDIAPLLVSAFIEGSYRPADDYREFAESYKWLMRGSNGRAIGFSALKHAPPDKETELLVAYTLPHRRREGVHLALLAARIEFSRRLPGCQSVVACTIDNEQAERNLRQAGFAEFDGGEHRVADRDDVTYWRLPL